MKEARPESRRRPSGKSAQLLHHGGQWATVKVRIDSFAGLEELIMNETAAAPPNTEHELLLEAGRPKTQDPPDRQKREELRGDSLPVFVSLLLLFAGDMELNPGPNCYVCRKPRTRDRLLFIPTIRRPRLFTLCTLCKEVQRGRWACRQNRE